MAQTYWDYKKLECLVKRLEFERVLRRNPAIENILFVGNTFGPDDLKAITKGANEVEKKIVDPATDPRNQTIQTIYEFVRSHPDKPLAAKKYLLPINGDQLTEPLG